MFYVGHMVTTSKNLELTHKYNKTSNEAHYHGKKSLQK